MGFVVRKRVKPVGDILLLEVNSDNGGDKIGAILTCLDVAPTVN